MKLTKTLTMVSAALLLVLAGSQVNAATEAQTEITASVIGTAAIELGSGSVNFTGITPADLSTGGTLPDANTMTAEIYDTNSTTHCDGIQINTESTEAGSYLYLNGVTPASATASEKIPYKQTYTPCGETAGGASDLTLTPATGKLVTNNIPAGASCASETCSTSAGSLKTELETTGAALVAGGDYTNTNKFVVSMS